MVAKEDVLFEELLALLKNSKLKVSSERVRRAYNFAKKAHDGQFRMSGEPYICHPVETAKNLAKLGVDEDTILAGLLHDVPEDTEFSVKDIEKRFGKHVASLVNALTKLSKVHYKHSMGERQVHALRKMFLETANDLRTVIIKLADRLHNMSTLHYLRPDKQQRIAKETLEIYAPLANLYGIYQLRRQLEDYCFMVLQPEEYARIKAFVHDHEKKRNHFINDTIEVLKKELKKANVNAELEGRPKHLYSIYQKMVRDQKRLQDIHDYFAIRVVTKNKEQCYRALGVIHETFKPKLGRFKDYIALPKPNGYQSLHTTVVGLRGKLTEIQIRTEEMHHEAEFGAAAHIFYKDNAAYGLRENIAQLQNNKNPESFIRGLQEDLLRDRIYVFSPDGDIINLPEGSTCLDYIYAAGLNVDKRVLRAVVNNKAYSLVGELQSGDHVQILYGEESQGGPQRWWLEHVRTNRAKEGIKSHFKRKRFSTKVEIGTKLLQQELDHESQGLVMHAGALRKNRAIEYAGLETFEEVLAQIGEGSLNESDVYKAMFPVLEVSFIAKAGQALMRLLRRRTLRDEPDKYKIRILIEAYDRVGLLREIVQPFYDLNIPILRFHGTGYDLHGSEETRVNLQGSNVAINPNHVSRDVIDVYIENHEQLIALFDRLEKVPGIIRVQRAFRRRQFTFFVAAFLTAGFFLAHPFFLKWMLETDFYASGHTNWVNTPIYGGLVALFFLMAWLRSLGNKTFPHFEETKYFWPVSFGLSYLAIITLFVDDIVFGLNLHLPFMIGISFLILAFLYGSYLSHQKQRARHLSRLKSSRMRAQNIGK